MEYNIIGFGGRLASGKTELATICEQYGYKKLYFALPLKQLCATLLDISIEEMNVLKRNNTPIDITVTQDWVEIISEETNIPFEIVNEKIGGKFIQTVRELLQYVGTDIIREYCPNWHVERIQQMIRPNEKYVIDDVRFPNEKKMIENMKGVCWYVIRPLMTNVSNHISETALEWKDFEDVIVNNQSLKYLKYHWELFMERGHDKSLKKRREIFQELMQSRIITKLMANANVEGKMNVFTLQDAYFVSQEYFSYSNKFVDNKNIEKVEPEDGYAKVTYKDSTTEIVKNSFLLEDLKIYMK